MPRITQGVAAIALLAAALPAAAQVIIEQGPVVNPANGQVYYRVWGSTDYHELRAFAQSLGGDLATINNDAENQWVWTTLVQPHGESCHIGLTDEINEGQFVWDNGEPVTYTAWASGEPNGGFAENFAHFYPDVPVWNDLGNFSISHAIVEIDNNGSCAGARPISTTSVTFDTLDQNTLGERCGGFDGGSVWFTFIGNERSVTINTCDNGGSNFDTVIEAFRGECGGLTCVAQNDDAGCGLFGRGSFVAFFAKAGERYYVAVQQFGGGGGGGETFNLTVNDSPDPPVPALSVGPVYNPGTGTSYYLTTEGVWQDQEALGQAIEGHLVTVNDFAENDFITSVFASTAGPLLIGYNDRAVEGAFVWSSGQTPGFTNWAGGEPNDLSNEDYTHIFGPGLWNDTNGSTALPAVLEVTNDSCYGAQPLNVGESVTAAYTPGGVGIGEIGCGHPGAFGRGIWYRVTGDGSIITANTCAGATFDTTLRVLTGDCGSLNCITGSDDFCGTRSQVSFYSQFGRTYYVVVGSFADNSWGGTYTLNVSSGSAGTPTFGARSDVNPADCSRYYAISDAHFLQAQTGAQAVGLNLATVADADDNAFIRAFASSVGQVATWIGFTDLDTPGAFGWVDGSPVTYTNWHPGEPNGGPHEFFVELLPDGRWNDLSDVTHPSVAEATLSPEIGGRIRGALAFSDDNVELPNNFWTWPGGNFTIECWFRTSGDGVIFGQFSTSGGHVPMIYVGVDGLILAADWTGSTTVVTGPFVGNGAWHHVAFVRTGFTTQLFVDGLLADTGFGVPQGYGSGVYQYYLGTGLSDNWPGDGLDDGFVGDIDEFRVWSVARFQNQILATRDTRYFNPANYGADLVAYLDLDDAGGGLAFDGTGHGHHGRLGGDPVWLYESRDGDKLPDACNIACLADIDGNGVVNSTDVSEFINMWFTDQSNGTLNADFNRDGVSNSTDVSDMINAYFAAGKGCV